MANRTILLRVFGLQRNELNVLKSVCTFSTNRARAHAFEFARDGAPADICIVDIDAPAPHEQWRAQPDLRLKPTVLVSAADTVVPPRARVLRRPVLASRLVAMLDEVALTEARTGPGTLTAVHNVPPCIAPQDVKRTPSAAAAGAVLVVDDSPTVRKQLELVLSELNVEVVAVSSGEAALDRVAERSFDLIFLDVVLPGTDGYQVCKAIKKDLDTKGTPVVMLTGKSSPFDRIRGSLAGCDTYLIKPVNRAEFEAVVCRYVKRLARPATAAKGSAAMA